jgi:N-acetyl-anhydromuramyl-L-alanine amidase AmpD
MRRIILHWTAGTNSPNAHEKQCYHYLIDSKGGVTEGIYKPIDNENCYDGKYAQHTGGGNTGSVGVAVCGCAVPTGTPVSKTKYPLTKVQLEKMFSLTAELCRRYGIAPTPQTVMTHYEFGKRNPKTSSAGKIDLTHLFVYSAEDIKKALKTDTVTINTYGDFIRHKVRWYLANSKKTS